MQGVEGREPDAVVIHRELDSLGHKSLEGAENRALSRNHHSLGDLEFEMLDGDVAEVDGLVQHGHEPGSIEVVGRNVEGNPLLRVEGRDRRNIGEEARKHGLGEIADHAPCLGEWDKTHRRDIGAVLPPPPQEGFGAADFSRQKRYLRLVVEVHFAARRGLLDRTRCDLHRGSPPRSWSAV